MEAMGIEYFKNQRVVHSVKCWQQVQNKEAISIPWVHGQGGKGSLRGAYFSGLVGIEARLQVQK